MMAATNEAPFGMDNDVHDNDVEPVPPSPSGDGKYLIVVDEENVNNTTAETSFGADSAPSDEGDESAVRSEVTLHIANTAIYTSFPSPSVKDAVTAYEEHRLEKVTAVAAWENQNSQPRMISLATGHMDVIDPKRTGETMDEDSEDDDGDDIEKGETEKGNASKCAIAMVCWCCFVCAMLAVLLALVFTDTVQLQSNSQLAVPEGLEADAASSLPIRDAVESATPTEIPTWSPTTAAPSLTGSPSTPLPTFLPTTAAPTGTSSPTGTVDGWFSSLTPPDILADETSIQSRARKWLLAQSEVDSTSESVQQRYVITMLDMAFHDEDSPFMARNESLSECDWLGITCNNESQVTAIAWPRQNLSTTLPTNIPEVGAVLTNLTRLDLAQNNLYGSLDALWQWQLTSVKELFLHENQFSGSIPPSMKDNIHALENLESLYLGHNQLTGSFPSVFDNMSTLRYLILHYNQFNSSLPMGLRFRKLFYFDISHNLFSGQLPTDWGSPNFVGMRHIYLDHNDFEGTIPQNFEEIGNHRLWQFFINDNPRLTGAFPDNWNNKVWPNRFMTNVDVSNTGLNERFSSRLCMLSVFEEGEMVEFRSNCDICNCDICKHTCI